MALPLRNEVHIGSSVMATSNDGGSDQPSGSYTPDRTGVTAAYLQSSVLQTVYYCQETDQNLAVVVLEPDLRTVRTAQVDEATPVLGIIQRKNSDTTAIVIAFGPVDGFTGLQIGQRYYLGPNGSLWTPPLLDESLPYVHPVGLAVTDTQLFVLPNWPRLKRDTNG